MSVSDEEWNEINENYINELKEEIERLRGALEEIKNLSRWYIDDASMHAIATKALEGETK